MGKFICIFVCIISIIFERVNIKRKFIKIYIKGRLKDTSFYIL